MKPAMRKSLWAMISKFSGAGVGAVGGWLIHEEKITHHMMLGSCVIWMVLLVVMWYSEYQREL